jgi:hypothetical protein
MPLTVGQSVVIVTHRHQPLRDTSSAFALPLRSNHDDWRAGFSAIGLVIPHLVTRQSATQMPLFSGNTQPGRLMGVRCTLNAAIKGLGGSKGGFTP